jgi:hypothetical protein
MYISFLLIIALIGALYFFLSPNPKRQELGRLTYVAAVLAFLLQMATVHQIFGFSVR